MSKIIRDGDIITIIDEATQTIDLGELQRELDNLKTETEPADQEVLEMAKNGLVHPYYENQARIKFLEEEIKRWQSI